MVERGRPHMKMWACALRAGYLRLQTHIQTLQQWWHERVSMLRYAYTACLVPHTFCCLTNPTLVLLHPKPKAKTLLVLMTLAYQAVNRDI